MDEETEETKLTIYFNPFLFTIEENNAMLAKGYEVMPIAIPRPRPRDV